MKKLLILLLLVPCLGFSKINPNIQEIVNTLTNNLEADIKSLTVKEWKMDSRNSFWRSTKNNHKDGNFALIKDKKTSYHGENYYLFTSSYSQCKRTKGFNDCKHADGVARTEYYSKKSSLTNGDEVWIHMAVKPVNNILYEKNLNKKKNSKNYFMQCYGKDGWNIFMIGFYPHHSIPSLQINLQQAGLGKKNNEWIYGGEENDKWKNFVLKLYKDEEINQYYGSSEWIKIVININHGSGDDAFFKVFINDTLTAEFNAPTFNPKLRKNGSCYIKFGNVSTKSKNRIEAYGEESAELMSIALDAISFGSTEEEMLSNIKD